MQKMNQKKDSSAPGNQLDNIEYCIRKGIGVYCIGKYLKMTEKTQNELADFLGITQPTISRWRNAKDIENGAITSTSDSRHAPTLLQIIKISSFFHKSICTMLKDVVRAEQMKCLLYSKEMLEDIQRLAEGMEENSRVSVENNEMAKLGVISKLQKASYLGFFISNESKKNIEHFIIDTAEAVRATSVLAFTRVIGKAENIYRCNIVWPPNQKHLYIYLRQDSGKYDRGIIVFKVDYDIQGEFVCGSGVMLSTDRKSEEKRLQWVVIIRIGKNYDPLTAECTDERNAPYIQRELAAKAEELNVTDVSFEQGKAVKAADAIIEPILKEPLPSQGKFYLDFDCLKERQEYLYEKLYEDKLKQIKFFDDER